MRPPSLHLPLASKPCGPKLDVTERFCSNISMGFTRNCLLVALLSFLPVVSRSALTIEEQKIVTSADALMSTFPRDLEQAVQINTATDELEGVRKVAHLFEGMLSDCGLTSQFIEMPKEMGRAGHLVGELKGNRGKRLLLIGHL